MADTAVETTTTTEISAKELKEKKEVAEEVVEKENGSGDAPGKETHTNGAEEKTNGAIHSEVTPEVEEDGEGEDAAEDAEEAAAEVDHPVKRPAEEEEQVETKKQKTENDDSKEAEVEA
ncbi:parathymosin [Salmo salar]|uniref:Parathymosin n=1 Tax=Salmo salar TaxID=8030 RepID=A0A1S3P2D1_SALSA|nr:parathymosin [Salmo salar]|eukprot:XP_014021792.1 PREDICTED: parathymosin-like [Salmo salar]